MILLFAHAQFEAHEPQYKCTSFMLRICLYLKTPVVLSGT